MTTAAITGLLSGRQKFFCDKFSQLIIREDSDQKISSSDANLSDWGQQDMHILKRMTISKEKTDKRFLNLYKIRRAMCLLSSAEPLKELKSLDIDEDESESL